MEESTDVLCFEPLKNEKSQANKMVVFFFLFFSFSHGKLLFRRMLYICVCIYM